MRRGVLALGLAGAIIAAAFQAERGETTPVPSEGTRMTSTDDLLSRHGTPIDPRTHPGRALFEANCAGCHNGGVPKAPAPVWLEMLEPDLVLASMNEGIMKMQAAHLTQPERRQIAEYLARVELKDYVPPAPPTMCSAQVARFTGAPPAAVGWGHDNARFVPAAVGGLTARDLPGLRLKWAFAYPASNRARSQPAIGWGTVFVGSQNGTVHAFDLDSGCAKWSFRAGAEVRTAIVIDAAKKRLYFGDVLGRAYAVDAISGKELWRRKVDEHPNATITGTPTLGGGLLAVPVSSLEVTSAVDTAYVCCSFRGSVVALDPDTGEERWKTYTVPEPPALHGKTKLGTDILGPSGAPVWNSPTYDARRNRFYFGSGENYSSPADENSDALFAVDAATGRKVWQVQLTKGDAWNAGCMVGNANCPVENGPDFDLASSAIIAPLAGGGQMIVVGQKSGMAYGISPDTGKVVWERRLGHGGTQGGVHFGMAGEGSVIYVPIVDMADTYDARVYPREQNGAGIHAVDAATGRILWSARADNVCNGRKYCDPGISAAATAIPGAVIAGHLDGRLRGYDRRTGRVLWSVDTTQPVRTISGVMASGGSMSGPGAAVYGGKVVVNSGYGLYFHMPGNLLMVFEKSR